MTHFQAQLAFHLAHHHPLTLSRPNLHWAIGSSITTDAARSRLSAIETLTLSFVATFFPEAAVGLFLLRVCFAILKRR
ncbi:MAG: hypothetical protein ACFB9N_06010 [Geitlerinemataceae cyanobacterium]